MITKDIAVEDCILDLLDNSIDGAHRTIDASTEGYDAEKPLKGFGAELTLTENEFQIKDNCGGMTVIEAKDYAFRFGRHRSPADAETSDDLIGLYGIGMKRAIFKMGTLAVVRSSTSEEAFRVDIDVLNWIDTPERRTPGGGWSFPLRRLDVWEPAGTEVTINGLYGLVQAQFADASFVAQFRKIVARDYTFYLQQGFTVTINGSGVEPDVLQFRTSDIFAPARQEYEDAGVKVELIAGMAHLPPDDTSAEARQLNVNRSGWYVACNDRLILAADKTPTTVWADEGFTAWHPQYIGFRGIAHFRSSDTRLLPWNTTKRGIDVIHPVYRRAVARMKKLTQTYVNYTSARRKNIDKAKEFEGAAKPVPLSQIPVRQAMVVPTIKSDADAPAEVSVQYSVQKRMLERAAESLGNKRLSASNIGRRTFEYYYRREVGE
jgi:hypothetical protein